MTAIISNLILLALALVGLWVSFSKGGWKSFTYYTVLSNAAAALSALCLLLFGQSGWITLLRYLATCMLTMTCLVTVFILLPLLGKQYLGVLLWFPSGIFVHVLCPIVSFYSYIFLEQHVPPAAILLPAAATLLYGVIFLILNAKRKFDGPYPFFRVHDQSRSATVLWITLLVLLITGISCGICVLAR